ncbi:hypothetical protein COOONC_01762 [Cooperia oncophora]
MQFPYAVDPHMAEFILSDYTINSLFYWLHRKQFLVFRVGPEIPNIGDFLRTTCDEDEGEGSEATAVEPKEKERRWRRKVSKKTLRTWRHRRHTATIMIKGRGKRQAVGGLGDIGLCFGEVLPALKAKYPKQTLAILVRTARAPSVIFSAARGGTVILDLAADADIFINGTNTRVRFLPF